MTLKAAPAAPITVLVTDPLEEDGIRVLESAGGFVIATAIGAKGETLEKALATADAWIVRSGSKVTADLLEKAPRLRLVGRAGTGVDNVDVDAATRRGIVVMNTPDSNSISAAEHTVALLLAVARHLPQAAASLGRGAWERGKFLGVELAGKTLGVIGFGRIGREVARRARAFDMTVLVADPYVTDEIAEKWEAKRVTLDDLLAGADFVTVHVPYGKATHHLLSKEAFAKMKRGARVVNCARGGIVDEAALLEAIESGRVAGAGLDVFAIEPPAGSPLLARPEVVATPHLGASTEEAQRNVAHEIALQVRDYFEKGAITNAVNMPALSAEAYAAVKPYLDLGERLGSFLGQLTGEMPGEIRVQHRGDAAAVETRAVTSAVLRGYLAALGEESVNYVNAHVRARECGIRVREETEIEPADYANAISVEAKTEKGATRVSGTVLRGGKLRLIAIDAFGLEATPRGSLLVLRNRDVPGVVGTIGTLLGKAGINITHLAWGSDAGGETAFTVIQTAPKVDEKTLDGIRSSGAVVWAKVVSLPE